ncbi:MAG: hypothetical protein WHT26_11665, partial [Thermus sp.]|uniref:type II secretion system protein GspD n=1 Tax=Thermus sp. TaxID=275 RepID=UPI00309D9F30
FQGKPFREVWDLLFATYGTQFNLDYLLLPPDVVVVAPTQVITALVDAPSRTGAMERKPYLVAIPEIAYRRTETDAQGQARTVVNIDGAKGWVQNDLLPFLSREASGLSVNWIVVEEGGKLRALLSVLATPEQHIRFSDILQRAGIDFRPLPALTLPKPRVERTYALTHSTFSEILSFLQTQVPNAQVAVVPTDPKRALITATEEDHARIAELLKVADAPKPKPRVERTYVLTHAAFPELINFLRNQVPNAQIDVIPTDPKRALVTATEEDHARLSELLKIADLPKPRVERTYTLTQATFPEVLDFVRTLVPNVQISVVPTDPWRAVVLGTEAEHTQIREVLSLIDSPSRIGAAERRPYIVGIPVGVYLKQTEVEGGRTQTEIDTEKAKAWIKDDLLPFLSREAGGLSINWIMVEEGTRLKALLSVLATPEQHARFTDILLRAGIDFRPLPLLTRMERRIYTLNYADAEKVKEFLEKEVAGITVQVAPVQSLLSVPEREEVQVKQEGFISVRPRTLSIQGTEEQLAEVEKLLAQLDQAPKQVNLRVRIQEVQSTFIRNLGLKWNTVGGGNVVASILDSGLSLIFDSTKSLAALNIIATLEALQRQGLSRALRDVNQTVLNNQTARLQSGETFLIRRVVDNRVERVPFDIGIIVAITPKVTEDGSILLSINAEVSGNVQRNPVDGDVDRFTKQQITTTLRLKDGQTVILGGLTSQENSQVQQGVPLLMDIPLIGELFKQRTQETTDRELLVVITADIVKETASR